MEYFFKYYKNNTLSFNMLSKGEIFFASIDELNDSSECYPKTIFQGTTEIWERFLYMVFLDASFMGETEFSKYIYVSEKIGKDLSKKFRKRDVSFEDLRKTAVELSIIELSKTELKKSEIDYFIRNIKIALREAHNSILEYHQKYICSFSESGTNSTLWGHYANADKGFAVIYQTENNKLKIHSAEHIFRGWRDTENGTEMGIYNNEEVEIKKVLYRKEPPKINGFLAISHKFSYSDEEDHYDVPLLIQEYMPKKKEKEIGLIKDVGWKYEKEIRIFMPVYNNYLPPEARIARCESRQVRGIIFGSKMTDSDKKRAIIACFFMRKNQRIYDQEDNAPFYFFHSIKKDDEFELGIGPLGLLDKSYYGSELLPLKTYDNLTSEEKKNYEAFYKEVFLTNKSRNRK